MDMFDSLLAIDKSLIAWIIQTSPADPNDTSQQQAMERVLAARGDVERALNTLIAYRLKLSAASLTADTATLNAIAHQMSAIDQDIAKAEAVVNLVGQAVQIAAKAIAFLAAA
jgi:hypothetical protein